MPKVPNERLRESYLHSGMEAWDIAEFAGFWRVKEGRKIPDITKLNRCLGLTHRTRRDGTRYLSESCEEESALAIVRALNLDPVDIGL